MKRIVLTMLLIIMTVTMLSCTGSSDKDSKNGEYEIAMIVDAEDIQSGCFSQKTWDCIKEFSSSYGISSKRYKAEESTKEAYGKTIDEAIANKAGIVIMSGSKFENVLFSTQSKYPDVKFLLIDGVPHDEGGIYGTAPNTIGVLFAEEEAGYLAGYSAVKEGFVDIAFLGGMETPGVKRYGYGFVQGAASAASELEQKIELRYDYAGTSEQSEDVRQQAAKWYEEGTQVIFTCGGAISQSVMDATRGINGKVIGADIDQSNLSDAVITSAVKNIEPVITDMLKNYVNGKFVGGTAFNYTAKNDGIGLHMDNAKFKKFTKEDYNKVYNLLKNDKIKLKKDTSVNSVKDLTGEWITIKYSTTKHDQ